MTTDTKAVALYPEVCPMQLDKDGGYYCRHVEAMTAEGLHRKSDIAEQLGWRDREIDKLRTVLAASLAEVKGLREVLAKIAASSTDEGGCYYTNKTNVRLAREAWRKTAKTSEDNEKFDFESIRILVKAVEDEFCSPATEEMEPDESKVSFHEETCPITFGMIRAARRAIDAGMEKRNV